MTPQEQPDNQAYVYNPNKPYCLIHGSGHWTKEHTDYSEPDSQAGDEPTTYPEFAKFLQDCHDGVAAIYTDKEKGQTLYNQQAAEAYAERLATERAIAELKWCRANWGKLVDDSDHIIAIDDRIAALSATLTGKADHE